ncbi:hypothetical protein GOBAR_DD21052 [Gossypium barbadense]|nr:hypothetical protein GOBAR_DD21052 [Gossypium barbadense]
MSHFRLSALNVGFMATIQICARETKATHRRGVGRREPVVEKKGPQWCAEEEPYGPWILVKHLQRGKVQSTGISKLDRNKHGAVRVVENGVYDAIKGKEKNYELGGSVNHMVELSATLKGIVREHDADLPANVLLLDVEVMDNDDIGNNEISC